MIKQTEKSKAGFVRVGVGVGSGVDRFFRRAQRNRNGFGLSGADASVASQRESWGGGQVTGSDNGETIHWPVRKGFPRLKGQINYPI
jgi:hypothetical protein